ncbi:MAG: hypothetical protein ABIR17_08400 [Pseudolysinimonas sp.]|uniref:hypothetical protein n=1 Tax=Pseudolysinimonas sp. TaxID=2680009 RepID=UPI0032639085
MSETPVNTNDRRRGWLGPLPVWAWVLITMVLVVGLLLIGVRLFSGGAQGEASSSPSPTPSAASPSPTASETPTLSPTPTETPDASGQGTFDSGMDAYLSSVLDSQNTAVLDQGGTFSNPVFVLAANSGLTQNMSPSDAVAAMNFMFTPSDPNPWDLALSDATLAGYRAGPYGGYFPVGAIVARSHDGHVFSFIGNDHTITRMFMASSDDLLH